MSWLILVLGVHIVRGSHGYELEKPGPQPGLRVCIVRLEVLIVFEPETYED